MKKKLTIYLISFFTILTTFTHAQSVNVPFKDGESLKYIVSYKVAFLKFDIAIATLDVTNEVLNGKECYKMRCVANTAPAFQSFFYMNDVYEVWLDKESLLPIQLINDNHEGEYRSHTEYYYDWDKMVVKTLHYSSTKPETKEREYSLTNESRDAISAFYYLRTIPFDKFIQAKNQPLELVFFDKIRNVEYSHTISEDDRVNGHGKQLIHKFKCSLAIADGDGLKEGNEFELWFADKDSYNKVPIFFASPIRVGSVSARLATKETLERFYK